VTAAFDAQQQIWQLGDIRRNPPRLVFGEQLFCRSPAGSRLLRVLGSAPQRKFLLKTPAA
jgi:hypothetical protein